LTEPKVAAVPLAKLKPADWNPRTIRDVRFQNLCQSIEADPEFLWRRPILATADGTIYAGNMRYRAASHLGMKTVPAIVEDVPERLAKERALRDNAQWGDWNDDQLAEMVYGLAADGADVKLLGIEDDELARLLGMVGVGGTEGLTDPDEIPEQVEPRVKRGDLWLLGEHRVLCGDATNAENVARVMADQEAAMCFTSPPYAAQREYTLGSFDWDALMDGVMGNAFSVLQRDGSALVNLGLVHRDGRVQRYWDGWLARTEATGMPLYGWYVWDQGWGLPGDWAGRLAPCFEFVFHFGKAPRHTAKTAATKSAGKIRNSTFRHADGSLHEFTGNGLPTDENKVPDAVIRVNRQIGSVPGGDHPAVFSVGFPGYCIPVWTTANEIVVDPFLGSGTTLIACEQLGRRCYGLEIEPKYVDVIVARWEQFTGRTAVLAD